MMGQKFLIFNFQPVIVQKWNKDFGNFDTS